MRPTSTTIQLRDKANESEDTRGSCHPGGSDIEPDGMRLGDLGLRCAAWLRDSHISERDGKLQQAFRQAFSARGKVRPARDRPQSRELADRPPNRAAR